MRPGSETGVDGLFLSTSVGFWAGTNFSVRQLQAMGRPADGLLWANAGLQQVHLPVEEYAQILRGTIGIEARDLESVARNAEKAMKAGTFRKTEFAMRRTTFQAPLEFESKEALEVNCPWGNRFLVTQATGNGSRDPVKQFWINGHDVAKSHGHPKPVAQNELLASVFFRCAAVICL